MDVLALVGADRYRPVLLQAVGSPFDGAPFPVPLLVEARWHPGTSAFALPAATLCGFLRSLPGPDLGALILSRTGLNCLQSARGRAMGLTSFGETVAEAGTVIIDR
ncbi:hypothetical protein [Streptomyces niveus]|uniref:hypothetical protein n=1 Tax=Streptomyces niveus TaxID=193462 RepID=UPI00342873C8